MKKVLSEYYGVNNNNEKTAKVFIETLGDEKKFYAECYINDQVFVVEQKRTAQAAEVIAEDFVLKNKSISD